MTSGRRVQVATARALRRAVLVLGVILMLGMPAAAFPPDHFADDGCRVGATGYFYAGGPEWGWKVNPGGGWNGCNMQTYTSAVQITNWAEWYLPIDPNQDGPYHLQAYVSSAGPWVPYTERAVYRRWPRGHSGGIISEYALNQRGNQGGFCYHLATANMYGSQGGLMDAIDYNTLGDGYLYVDVFCFRGAL